MDDIAGSAVRPGATGTDVPAPRPSAIAVRAARGGSFRLARSADAPAIVALVESAYRGDSSRAGWTTEADLLGGQRTNLDVVTGLIAAPDVRVLLVHDTVHGAAVHGTAAATADAGGCVGRGCGCGGCLVACCQLERRGRTTYFGMFAVSPTRQRGGVGAALLDEAERYARHALGSTRMEMLVISLREELLAWYKRRGYHATGQREPFPYYDSRFGVPKRPDLEFVVLAKELTAIGTPPLRLVMPDGCP